MQDPQKAIYEYYKLKSNYEKKYNKYVSSINQDNTLTQKEKESKLAKFKFKCILCKKDGGTIFSSDDNKLKAICGNVNSPCELNIVIEKGTYTGLNENVRDFEKYLEDDKVKIICTKLDLLFNYEKEVVILEKFKKMKEDFELDSIVFNEQLTKLNNIENNSMTKVNLKVQNEQIYEIIDQIKQNITSYNETNDEKYIKSSIQIYNNTLQPLLKDNMNTKYQINNVQYNESDETYHLIQNKIKFSDLIEEFEKPKVISFKIGKQ